MPDPAAGSPLAVGAAITALPMDHMIAVPILAAVNAQIRASKLYVDFINDVGMKDGKPIMIPFTYEEDKIGVDGQIAGHSVRRMNVPLLAILEHPAMNVDSMTIDFEMEVSTMESEHSMTSAEGGFDASVGWGPFSVHVHGKVSHKSEQTRSTDTRSKYSFHVQVKHVGQSEGMKRVLDALVDSAVRPATVVDASGPAKHEVLPAPAPVPKPPATP